MMFLSQQSLNSQSLANGLSEYLMKWKVTANESTQRR